MFPSFFKKDKFTLIVTAGFLIWVVFLIILSFSASREIHFTDYLQGIDVTSSYTSTIPIGRYFLEPIIGLTFSIGVDLTWIFTFILFFPIARVSYAILRKGNKIKSKKFLVLSQIAKNYLLFALGILLLVIIGVVLYLLIGFLISGFIFLNNHWQTSAQVGLSVATGIILFKLGVIVYRYYRPKSQLAQSNPKKGKNNKILRGFKITGKELRLFLAVFLFIGLINVLLLTVPWPAHKIETTTPGPNEYLFDFHVHTTKSDGFLTPEERVDWYIQHGIHGAAFTDHENQRGYERAKTYIERRGLTFHAIRGQEYTYHALDIHLNYFGVADIIVPPGNAKPGDPSVIILNVSNMIAYVKSKGGFVIVNHYSSPPGSPYTYNELLSWGVDGFEIINNGREYSVAIRNFCIANNGTLACIAGSDTHTNQELNSFVKLTLNSTFNDPSNLTHIFQTLKLNNHECVWINLYPNPVNTPDTLVFDSFRTLTDYFTNLDIFQILSWIFWSIGGYVLVLFLYGRFKKADINRLKNIKVRRSLLKILE
ncbi:MAG: hypothetical protein HWN65_07150 [Candidatus Helarchaeota archaeon]|nr:hypothetical protein [Candidatus Helarchaeota archaeon]